MLNTIVAAIREIRAPVTISEQELHDLVAQALNDKLVAAITLLNELRAATVEKGLIKDEA